MDDGADLVGGIALYALTEALRSKAELMAVREVLNQLQIPHEVMDRAYLVAARHVAEEARTDMGAAGLPARVIETIVNELLAGLPEETSGRDSDGRSN